MKLRRYAVTVMDNWTPWRSFFTYEAARRFKAKTEGAYLFKWSGERWVGIS